MPEAQVTDAVANLVQMGILGPIVVVLGYMLYRSQQQLNKVQGARVSDAQKVVDRLLALQQSIDNNTAATQEMRQDLERLRS